MILDVFREYREVGLYIVGIVIVLHETFVVPTIRYELLILAASFVGGGVLDRVLNGKEKP